jgi:hypothetical protein
MLWLSSAALLTAAYPLLRMVLANLQTTLRQATLWTVGAWACWLLVFVGAGLGEAESIFLGRHLALTLTGCAGVAVLGARRPGVRAWNFVVCGLLAVLLMSVVEGRGQLRIEPAYLVFLAGTLAVGVVNYLPTRQGLAALLLALGSGLEFALEAWPALDERAADWLEAWAGLFLAAAPWAGFLLARRPRAGVEAFDGLWLDFRDRYGVVWGQRTREQFNRSAAHAGWPVALFWDGLIIEQGKTPPDAAALTEKLRALLKRFGPED